MVVAHAFNLSSSLDCLWDLRQVPLSLSLTSPVNTLSVWFFIYVIIFMCVFGSASASVYVQRSEDYRSWFSPSTLKVPRI